MARKIPRENSHQSAFETGMIDVFSEMADLFGNPRSHGQIYGLLFASPTPKSMEEIAKRLNISMGSASMGLRTLEEFGAIERHPAPGRGQAIYSARLELRNLIAGFMEKRLIPRLEANAGKLQTLTSLAPELPDAETARARLQRVQQWHDRASILLPMAEKILQATGKRSGWNPLSPKPRIRPPKTRRGKRTTSEEQPL